MDRLQITGGRRLRGEVTISGAKNAALPILCASLLTAGELVISQVPYLKDIHIMLSLLKRMGVMISRRHATVSLKASSLDATYVVPDDLVKAMRASILTLGPLLARFGQACVPLPGGCAIGARPVDQHIKGLRLMGADVRIDGGYILAKARRLHGAHIVNDVVTVTGTENLLMAAMLAEGETVIDNAAREPEVIDLARCLTAMGGRIQGAGSKRIVVQGVRALHGAEYEVMPDRVETGTYLCAVAATGGHAILLRTSARYLEAVIHKLRQAGCEVIARRHEIYLRAPARLRTVNIHTDPYPGFPTDMQAQFMAMNAVAHGTATICETIFENRFMHVRELSRFGADIRVEGYRAFIAGRPQLTGAYVVATDLRASASLVIAGLVASGTTVIDNIYHLDRGYEHLDAKFSDLGACVVRERSYPEVGGVAATVATPRPSAHCTPDFSFAAV